MKTRWRLNSSLVDLIQAKVASETMQVNALRGFSQWRRELAEGKVELTNSVNRSNRLPKLQMQVLNRAISLGAQVSTRGLSWSKTMESNQASECPRFEIFNDEVR